MSRLAGTVMLCILMALVAAGLFGAAQLNAVDILKRAHEAEVRAVFSGRLKTTLYGQRGQVSAEVKISQSGRRSRMEYLSGPSKGRTIIDTGSSMIRLDSRSKTAYLCSTPSALGMMDLMLRNYTPVLMGSARIAGRDCYYIRLNPESGSGPSKRLWIDKHTLVTLRMETYGSKGLLQSCSAYSSVDYTSRPSGSLFEVPRRWKTVQLTTGSVGTGLDTVRKAVGFTPLKPGYCPKGYSFDGYCVRSAPVCGTFAGLRYTNGMNTVSVFERKGGCLGRRRGCGQELGHGQRGTGACPASGMQGRCLLADGPQTNVVGTVIGDITVIIVGDVDGNELKRMAGSLK